jgi:polar amino acid transport system substrate-binding protein
MRQPVRIRLAASAGVLVLTSALVAACGGDDSSGDGEGERVRVGIVDSLYYSGLDQSGNATGVCPDLVNAVFRANGEPEPEYIVAAAYSDLISGLQADRWDMVGACLQLTPERCEQVAFTDPLETESFAFAVNAGNPKNLTTLQQFAEDPSLRLGILRGSVMVDRAKAAGVQESSMVLFQNVRDALDGVNAGRADAMLTGRLALHGIEVGEQEVVNVSDITLNPAGAAVMPDDTELLEEFNAGLQKIKDSGEFVEITEKYGLDPSLTIDKTAEAVCAGES